MSWRVIDIAESGRYLHAEREWLVVEHQQVEIGRVALSDIQSILVHGLHATYSHSLLLKLAEHNIPLVICDKRHEPLALLTSLNAHHAQGGRTNVQAEASLPLKKRIWRDLVRAKIREQARSLEPVDKAASEGLLKLSTKVRSGDTENMEARAARFYWPVLFGKSFRRDRDADGLNAHLNYGYAILRSALARLVVGAGLSPSLGVGHTNQRNQFCLVDDLMEPFRPLVDRTVYENRIDWAREEMTAEAKAVLAGLLTGTLQTTEGETDLLRVMALAVNSLAQAYEGSISKISLPKDICFVSSPQLPGLRDQDTYRQTGP